MKIIVNLAPNTKRIVKGSSGFHMGRVYRCVVAHDSYSGYLGVHAWLQDKNNTELGLEVGKVYCSPLDGYEGGIHGSGGCGLEFNENFHFEELPIGTTLIVQSEVEVRKKELVSVQIV